MNIYGLIFVLIGLFALCGACFDWAWFMNHRKARFFVSVLGRRGARMFYAALGGVLVVAGVLFEAGLLS